MLSRVEAKEGDGMAQNGDAGLGLMQIGRYYADANMGRRFGHELLIKYLRARVPDLRAGCGAAHGRPAVQLLVARIVPPAGLRPPVPGTRKS